MRTVHPTGAALRAAGLCGLVAFVTFNVGWIGGDIAQPRAFSPADDDISYLGALTASKPWLYNQLAANASGALVVALGTGLWRALDRAHAAAPARGANHDEGERQEQERDERCGHGEARLDLVGVRVPRVVAAAASIG